MKTKKRRPEFFSFYDHTGIERHLERMAERGWLLDKIGGVFWRYRRVEPQKLTFSMTYFPKVTQYDPTPTEEQETFYDFCEHTGWTLAAASGQMQAFYNEREHPIPIDTDPMVQVDAIHRSVKKGWLPAVISLLVVGIMEEVMFLSNLNRRPLESLCNPAMLMAMLCWMFCLLLGAVEMISYFTWRRRAKQAAEQGEFLPTKSHPVFQKIIVLALTLLFVWWIASLAALGPSMWAVGMAALVAFVLVVVGIVRGVQELMRRKKVPAETNRAVSWALSISLSVALTFGVVVMVIGLGGKMGNTLRANQIALTLPELLGESEDDTRWHRDVLLTQSPLAGYLEVRQYFLGENGDWTEETSWLTYNLVTVRVPALYDICKNELLTRHDTRDKESIPEGDQAWYESTDPAPWGADEAFQRCYQDPEVNGFDYLLCYPDRIVEIGCDWEPTPEQAALTAEKLSGR